MQICRGLEKPIITESVDETLRLQRQFGIVRLINNDARSIICLSFRMLRYGDVINAIGVCKSDLTSGLYVIPVT